MFIIRNVFKAKPGKGKAVVEVFKKVAPHTETLGCKQSNILTDVTGPYWTVVVESKVESVADYFEMSGKLRDIPEVAEAMDGYLDLLDGGYREILKLEHTS